MPWSRTALVMLLLLLSVLFTVTLERLGLPAAPLLGPLFAGMICAALGATFRPPKTARALSQATVGCLIASGFTPAIVQTFAHTWPAFLALGASTLVFSNALGLTLSRRALLPGSTAFWGAAPGGAASMSLMASDFGADPQLVAFMQYLRVVMVTVAATLVARFFVDTTAPHHAIEWLPTIRWHGLLESAGLIALGAFVGARIPIGAGAMLLPMLIGAVATAGGWIALQLPPWLLIPAYVVLGWQIGLGFSPALLRHAQRAFPAVLGSTLMLIVLCALVGVFLVLTFDMDPLTAYLATSPGGLDAVAIIAATSKVDLPFVMTAQTVRFALVMLLQPPLARWLMARFPTPGRA